MTRLALITGRSSSYPRRSAEPMRRVSQLFSRTRQSRRCGSSRGASRLSPARTCRIPLVRCHGHKHAWGLSASVCVKSCVDFFFIVVHNFEKREWSCSTTTTRRGWASRAPRSLCGRSPRSRTSGELEVFYTKFGFFDWVCKESQIFHMIRQISVEVLKFVFQTSKFELKIVGVDNRF